MARVGSFSGFCLAATLLVGACGQSSLSAPRPASLPEAQTRATPPKPLHELPRLIAPPPAYGNKIVLAERATALRRD